MTEINLEDLFVVPELDEDCEMHGDAIPADAEDQEGVDE